MRENNAFAILIFLYSNSCSSCGTIIDKARPQVYEAMALCRDKCPYPPGLIDETDEQR